MCPDEGDIGCQTVLEDVLNAAQAKVNAVQQEGGVVNDIQQRHIVRHSTTEVGQLQLERHARLQARNLGQQRGQTRRAQRGVGVDVQVAQRNLTRQRHQTHGQVDVHRALGGDFHRTLVQRQAQHSGRKGVDFAVLVDDHLAVEHAQSHLAHTEAQHQIGGTQAGCQIEVSACSGFLVEVQQRHGRCTRRCARQGNAHASDQVGPYGISARSFARGIEQIGKVRR